MGLLLIIHSNTKIINIYVTQSRACFFSYVYSIEKDCLKQEKPKNIDLYVPHYHTLYNMRNYLLLMLVPPCSAFLYYGTKY